LQSWITYWQNGHEIIFGKKLGTIALTASVVTPGVGWACAFRHSSSLPQAVTFNPNCQIVAGGARSRQ